MAAAGLKAIYAYKNWKIDLNRREFLSDGDIIPLGRKCFDVIEILVQSAGSLVTKNELMAAAWPGMIVEENTIQVHISAFRKALGPDRALLQTTSGRGYRLLGDWTAKPTGAAAEAGTNSFAAAQQIRGNLPARQSDLIGRAVAVQHLRDLLSTYRAVTLIGPGGIGKTRLALEVAHGVLAASDAEVWLVELASLIDHVLVPSAVVAAMGLEVRGSVISAEAVARAIGGRKLLLVMDNCEHVVDAAARLAETLLRSCPGITVLSTSREGLEIEGEFGYRVPPLSLPPAGSIDLLDSSAVQLFLARTHALSADVPPNREALAAISAICRRLDGIPLAIEFAAARVATLGLGQVLARLDDRFALLTAGRRTALPRHQTLRATLDWSYGLLPDADRRILRYLAVFVGGFSLEAAAVVIDSPTAVAVEGIASLVSKSLLGLEGSGAVGRWRLLETTRAYALAKLVESGDAPQAARRHAAFFRDLLAPQADSTAREAAFGKMTADARDVDNIRAALDWAFSADGDAAIGVALTIGAVPLWVHLSLMHESRGRVERALAGLDRDMPEVPRARMQLSAALGWSLMFAVGRSRETGAAWSTTLELAQQLGDTSHRLRALWGLWVDSLNNGAFRRAADLARDFAGLVADSSDAIDRMMADRMLATSFHYLGDQTNARHHIEIMLGRPEAPALDPQVLRFQFDQRVTAHYFQARILWLQGFADQALRVVGNNLVEARSVGNALSFASVLGQGACLIALFSGDFAAAEQHGAALLEHADRQSLGLWQGWARAFRAAMMVRQGNVADGLRLLRAELAQAADARFLPRYLVLIGELACGLGKAGEAALGLETVEAAIERCEANEERWYLAELLRVRGELVRQTGAVRAAAIAEECYMNALDCAGRQGALAWALRSAMSLTRLRRDLKARQRLSVIYGQFSEGFDTADLQAARQLLTELA